MNTNAWHEDSAIRERLALLAALGPALEPSEWLYDSRGDCWYADTANEISITQEASGSLGIIAVRWLMDRKAAMAFIGYPEAE